jgi:DNA-binding MarR family transcriptional regulator
MGEDERPASWDDLRVAAVLRGAWRRAQAAMTHALAENGLSNLQYHLLLAISAAGQAGIRQVDLAHEVDAPKTRVSLLAHQLASRRLIEAVRSEPDRRYVRLRLSPEGLATLRAAMRSQRHSLEALVGGFSQGDLVSLVEFLARQYLGLDLEVRALPRAIPREPSAAGEAVPYLP